MNVQNKLKELQKSTTFSYSVFYNTNMNMKIKKRKEIRIKYYNYSNEGYYFVTICTKERKCILSNISYDNENGMVDLILSSYGKSVENVILSINNTYDDVRIENYVIMPNHIHFICSITNSKLEFANNYANNRLPTVISTLKRFSNKRSGTDLWQRNYYEHIIRNEKEYLEILEYIDNNPYKWELDKYFS